MLTVEGVIKGLALVYRSPRFMGAHMPATSEGRLKINFDKTGKHNRVQLNQKIDLGVQGEELVTLNLEQSAQLPDSTSLNQPDPGCLTRATFCKRLPLLQ
jgi:hypothetical protein